MGADKKSAVDEYATTLIRVKARQLVGKYGFTKSDRPDIEQDLALHLIEHQDQFDPTRGNRSTFLDRIVNRRIISILRQRFAQRRDYSRATSIDNVGAGDEHEAIAAFAVDESPHDLAINLAHAIENFDVDTRRMCGVLMHESIAETARRLGLTRAEARTRIARIRKLLTDSGLEVYVNEGAAKFNTDGVCNK